MRKGVCRMRQRTQKIIEHIKTAAILFLMVMLVCLCMVYMLSYQGLGQYAFTKDTMRTLGGESVKYQYADYYDRAYVSPKLIVFSAKEQGRDIGFYTLGGENAEVYASILPFYEKLLSAEGKMTPLLRDEGRLLFEEGMAGDFIYVSYETDLPKDLICSLSLENETAPASTDEYVREILIVPGTHLHDGISLVPSGTQVYTSIYTFYAVARDSLDNYYCYTTEYVPLEASDVSFNTNYYLTYTTTETHFYCDFVSTYEQDPYFLRNDLENKATATTVIVDDVHGALPQNVVSTAPYYPESSVKNALLAALLMNPEKVTSFTDGSGVRFYYDEGRNASISPAGHLEYTAYGEAGLPLADLFSYPAANEVYDLRDYIGASLMLARDLEDAAGAGDGYDLFLNGVYSDGNTVTVSLGYAVCGLPIYFEGYSDVIVFEFENGMLKKVAYDLRCVEVSERGSLDADMLWALRSAIAETEIKREYAYGYLFRLREESVTAELVGRVP